MDLLAEIDALFKLIDESRIDRARLKLVKVRVGVQNLIENHANAMVAVRETRKELQLANKRRMETSKALGTFSMDPSAHDRQPRRKNGSRKRNTKI
jgi:hypothetical protein